MPGRLARPCPVSTAHRVPRREQGVPGRHGTGVQIYKCNGSAWTFVAPEADLVGDNGKVIVTHFVGPTWQAKDGSKVEGTVQQRATVNPDAIPWLLLSTTATTDVCPPAGSRSTTTSYTVMAGGVVDDEERVEPVQGDGVEVEQVAGEDRVRLNLQELGP